MSCIKTFTGNFVMDCTMPQQNNGISRIVELILVDRQNISAISYITGSVTMTRVKGTQCSQVSLFGNSSNIQLGVHVNEGVINAWDITAVIKFIDNATTFNQYVERLNVLASGKPFVVCVKDAQGKTYAFGVNSGLVASEGSMDTTNDGYISLTLKTPETSNGDFWGFLATSIFEALKLPAI